MDDRQALELLDILERSPDLYDVIAQNVQTEFDLRFLADRENRPLRTFEERMPFSNARRLCSRSVWTRVSRIGSLAIGSAAISLVLIFVFLGRLPGLPLMPSWNAPSREVAVAPSPSAHDVPPIVNYSMLDGSWGPQRGHGSAEGDYPAEATDEWTDLLRSRTEGWSGADGIYTANLDGTIGEGIENRPGQRTVFVFSDTIVGKVNRQTNTRCDTKMVNHSFAVLDGNEPLGDRIEFFYENDGKTPRLPIQPSPEGQWYWLSECFVLNDAEGPMLHTFLLRMERRPGNGAFGFHHLGVDLLRIPVRDGKLDFDAAIVTEDKTGRLHGVVDDSVVDNGVAADGANAQESRDRSRGMIFFGTGVLENLKSAGAVEPDGYLYVYGYKDEHRLARRLVVARVPPEDVARFDRWTYYSGNDQWSADIRDCAAIADGVSTELSVTPIPSGPKTGKYALIYTPGTVGSTIALRIGDSPVGPFGEEQVLFKESETATLGKGVFAYNAKAHPVLSKSDSLVISYNVNSNDDTLAIFREPDIYFPRFIKIRWEDILETQ